MHWNRVMNKCLHRIFLQICLQSVTVIACNHIYMINMCRSLFGRAQLPNGCVINETTVATGDLAASIGKRCKPLQTRGKNGGMDFVEAAVSANYGVMVARDLAVIAQLRGAP